LGAPASLYQGSEESSVTTAFWGVLVVLACMLAAVAGLGLVNRLVPTEYREEHNDVAGFIYAVVGVVYAVLLAFVVVASWEDFEAARDTTEVEANELAEIFWLAHRFPESQERRLHELSRSYARVVVDQEWLLMQEGRESPHAWALLNQIRSTIEGYEPRTQAGQVLYEHALERVRNLAEARRDRLLEAEQGMPAILWAALVVGGVITVGFTYLFGLKSNLAHTLMIAALTAILTMVIVTIGALEGPFSGDVRVPPSAFELVLDRFESNNLSGF
jgi:hypothetical protein